MRGKLMVIAGAAVGYVLGSRAGRQRYEQLADAARDIATRPNVRDAVTAARVHAQRIYGNGLGPAIADVPEPAMTPSAASRSTVSPPTVSPSATTPTTAAKPRPKPAGPADGATAATHGSVLK